MPISKSDVIDEFREAEALTQTGSPLGGGAEPSDQDSAGGSSGTGGYGNAQDRANHQGQNAGPDAALEHPNARELSRGERFDLEQGGGRGDDAVDFGEELKEDQQEHQDRGQRFIDEEGAISEGRQP